MSNTRDADGDFTAALRAEYRSYLIAGLAERAESVAVELRARGVDIPRPVETKVDTPAVETKVETVASKVEEAPSNAPIHRAAPKKAVGPK